MKKLVYLLAIFVSTFFIIPILKADENVTIYNMYTNVETTSGSYSLWQEHSVQAIFNFTNSNTFIEFTGNNTLKQNQVYKLTLRLSATGFKNDSQYAFDLCSLTNRLMGKTTGDYETSSVEVLNRVCDIKSSTTGKYNEFTYLFKAKYNLNGILLQILAPTQPLFRSFSYDYTKVEKITDVDSAVQELVNIINEQNKQIGQKLEDLNKNQEETNNKLDDLNNTMKDDNVSGGISSGNDFFDNFNDSDYGLSDVVTMPLQFINNIASATCTPLTFPIPFVNTTGTLPCLTPIYEEHFGNILTIYQTITFGMVAYWVCINIFRMVKNFKNPDNDEVEVLDL